MKRYMIIIVLLCVVPSLFSLEFIISEKKKNPDQLTAPDSTSELTTKTKSIDDVLGMVKKVDDVDAKLKDMETSKNLNISPITKSDIAGTDMVGNIDAIESDMKDLSMKRSELSPDDIQTIRKDEEMKISEIKLAIATLNETKMASPQVIEKLNTELKDRETKLAELDSRLADFELRQKEMEIRLRDLKQESFMTYTIKYGDYLSKISKRPEFMGQGALWPLIYRYNKDRIKDPDLIMPGWVITIPIKWYVTGDDDTTLYVISQKIYGTREKWLWLSWANAQIINNPNRVQPGTKIKIPLE